MAEKPSGGVRMNNTKFNCSLNDTTILRNLILENPELPLLIFCGEEAWNGDWCYNQAYASEGKIKSLTLYGDTWMDEDDYRDKLSEDLCEDPEYKDLPDEDYEKMLDKKVAETEFVTAIVIYVG